MTTGSAYPPGAEGTPLATSHTPATYLGTLLQPLRRDAVVLLAGPLLAGLLALGVSMLVTPDFTASTTFMPPQQAQGISASALASLGSLAGLAGGGGVRNTADQYVALMRSTTVSDKLIERYKLQDVYDEKFRIDTRRELARRVQMRVGKKDGLISIDVDDPSPQRAAEIANQYVEELRTLTSTLAVTEAQQRRLFFERLLLQSRDQLAKAQQALQASGFNAGALKAEPRAAAEAFARLRAEATSVEVRLQTLRGSLADDTPEVRQAQAALAALRGQLARVEQSSNSSEGPDYVGRYREFKYQETLFELYARQFELARVDESREGALIQVVDTALPPEKKSSPRRAFWAVGGAALMAVLLAAWSLLRSAPAQRSASRRLSARSDTTA